MKKAAQSMSKPLIGDWAKLNRIGRYLVGRPRLVSLFAWQASTLTVTAYTDSDWPAASQRAAAHPAGLRLWVRMC